MPTDRLSTPARPWFLWGLCAAVVFALLTGRAGAQLPNKVDRLYVPVDQFELILQRHPHGVLLPKEEFEKLWNAAQSAAGNRPSQTPAIVITRVDYDATIRDRQLVISAEVGFRQFESGWRSLRLALDNISVEDAKVGDAPARLGRGAKGALQFFHETAGDGVLSLTLSTPLAAAGSDQVAGFGLISSPVAELKFQAPAGKHLLLDEQTLERPAAAAEAATYVLAVGGRANVRLRLTDREDERKTDRLVFAHSTLGIDASPGEITWQSVTDLQVFGASFNQLLLTVPRDLEIADVQSSGLDAWELAEDPDDADRTQITLNFRQPIDGRRSVRVRGVLAMPSEEVWSIPMLSMKNVTSHVGHLIVTHPLGVRMQFLDSEGVRRATAITIQAANQNFLVPLPERGPPDVFEFWREDAELQLIMRSRQRELTANVQNLLEFQYEHVRYVGEVTVAARYAPLFEFDVELPAEWTPETMTLNGKPVQWQDVSEEAGVQRLRVPLQPPLVPGGQLKLKLEANTEVADWPPADEAITVELPQLTLPQVQLIDGRYFLSGDADFELKPVELEGLTPVTFEADGERTAYEYQDVEISGAVDVSLRPTTISARTLTFVRLEPRSLESMLEAVVTLDGAGRRQIRVSLPESAGRNVRFTLLHPAADLIEQTPSEPDQGRIEWTLTTDRRLSGDVAVFVQVTLARGADDNKFTVPDLRIVAAERQNGIVAIEARPEQSLTFKAVDSENNPLLEVDPVDIPAPLSGYVPRERIVAAFHAFRPGSTVTITETRFDRSAVPTAVCRMLSISSLLGESGRWQHEAKATFASFGVQSLLVTLPENASLWATVLDGDPIEVRRVGERYLIPLTGGTPGKDRVLRLFYNNNADPLQTFGRVEQTPPQLAVDVLGEAQPLEVLDQDWNVYSPGEIQFIHNDGQFRQPEDFKPVGLLASLPDLFGRLTWEHAGEVGIAAAVLLILFFFVERMIVRWGWSLGGTLTLVSVVIFVGCLLLLVVSVGQKAQFNRAPADTAGQVGYAAAEYDSAGAASASGGESAEAGAEEMPPVAASPEAVKGEKLEADMESSLERDRSEALKEAPATPNDRILRSKTDGVQKEGGVAGREATPQEAGQLASNRTTLSMVIRQNQKVHTSARLSVNVSLEVPAGYRRSKFRYYGTRQTFETDPLDVLYLNRNTSGTLTAVVAVLVLGLFWMLRARRKTVIVAMLLGFALPLALVSVAPAAIGFVLDGIWIGTIVAAAVAACACCWRCCCVPLCRKLCSRCCPGWFSKTTTTAVALILLSGLSQQTFAQGKQGEAVRKSPKVNHWTVIVPYDAGSDPLSAEKVFLTQEGFLRLWNTAHPDEPLRGRPPAGAVIAGAAYVANLEVQAGGEKGSVLVNGRLVIHQLTDRAQTIALPLGRVALESARVDGEPAALAASGNPKQPAYRVTTSGKGPHVLDLVFRLPAQLAGEAGQFVLPHTGGGPGALTFRLPGKKLNVRVNGTTTAFRKTVENGAASIRIPLPDKGAVTVAWAPPQSAAGVDRVITVESQAVLRAADAGLSLHKTFNYHVAQGAVEELLFELPQGWNLQTIAGPDVGGWQIEGNDEQRQLRVFLRRAVDETTSVSFEMFRAVTIGSDPLDETAPKLAPLEVTRETGTIGLFGDPYFILRSGTASSVSRIDNQQFGQVAPQIRQASTLQLAYRFSRPDYEQHYSILRKEPEAKSESRHGVIFGRNRSHIASNFQVDLTGTPRSRLSIRVEEDYVVLDVQANHLQDWYTTESPDGDKVLILELTGPVTGRLQIALTGYRPKYPDDELGEVFVPVLLEMSEDKTSVGIWGVETYTIKPDEIDGWQQIDADRLSPVLRKLQPKPPQLAYEATQIADRYLSVAIEQALPKLTGHSVVVANVTDSAIVYQIALKWEIEDAAAERLAFTTPDWLAGKLDFSDAPNLRNYSSESTDDGRVRWTVFLSQPQSGEFFLSPLAVVPVPDDGKVTIPRLEFERNLAPSEIGEDPADIPPRALPRQSHFAVLINGSSGRLNVDDESLLEAVPAESLPIHRDNTTLQQATDIFRLRPERGMPSWTMESFERKRGAEAIVNYADLTTILSRDGGWRMQASYLIRNRARQFLPLKIPAGARILSAFVKNVPVRPVTTKIGENTVYLLPLPKASAADLSFVVRVALAGNLAEGDIDRGLPAVGEEVALPAPEVVEKKESPEFGIPVSRTRWSVWVPDGLSAEEVEDVEKTNLSRRREAETEIELRLAQLKEANDLVTSVEGKSSLGVQINALNNLNALQNEISKSLRIHNFYDGQSKEARKLRAEQDKLKYNYQRLQSNLAGQQQAAQSGQLGEVLEQNIDNLSDFSSRQQLELLRSGNQLLYQSNSSGSQVPMRERSSSVGKDINFNSIVDQGRMSAEDAKQLGGKTPAKPGTDASQKRIANDESNQFFFDNAGRAQAGQGNAPAQQPRFNFNRQGSGDPFAPGGSSLSGPARPQGQTGGMGGGMFGTPGEQQGKGDMAGMGGFGGRAGGAPAGQMNTPVQQLPSGDMDYAISSDSLHDFVERMGNMPLSSRGGAPAPQQGGFGGVDFNTAGNQQWVPGASEPAFFDSNRMLSTANDVLIELTANGTMSRFDDSQSMWSSTSGLSIDMQLPTAGHKLVFAKVGGAPRLALSITPDESWMAATNMLWLAVWAAAAVFVVWAVRRDRWKSWSCETSSGIAAGWGLLFALVLPPPLTWIGLAAMFAAGIAVVTVRYRHRPIPEPAAETETKSPELSADDEAESPSGE